MWRQLFSQFSSHKSRRTARRRAKPHRFSGRRPAIFAAEQLEARWYLSGDPIVQVNTNYGNFQLELFPDTAPQTVANFLSYVDSGKFNNLVVSRNGQGGFIQSGQETSPTATYTSDSQFTQVTQGPTIPDEYSPTHPDTAGTIAMARVSQQPNSAASSWFINVADHTQLYGPNGNDAPYGYAVFGQVLGNGLQVVDAMNSALSDTANTGGTPVTANGQLGLITSMTLLDGAYGTVFGDTNGNGTQDPGETGVANEKVFVNVDGTGQLNNNPSATTDASGNYYIAAVPAGTYQVEAVPTGGLVSSTPLQTVTFGASTPAANVNLGETIPSISGKVFTDLNSDSKLDTVDPGVADRTVTAVQAGNANNSHTTMTDANGNFSFVGLSPGTYNVSEESPSGVTVSTNTQSIVVATGQPATADIGEQSSIIGIVFNDMKVSGKFATSDPGISGVTVFLNNDKTGKPDSNNPSTTTDALGRFYFSGLSNGPYTVEQAATNGLTTTTTTSAVNVASGSPPPTVTIGDVLTSPIIPLPGGVNTQAPPSNANAAFIDDLYFTLLGHLPDANSLASLQQQMNGGTTRATVAQDVWDSAEHRALEVTQFYQMYLNRAPDAAGDTFWINRFESGGLTEEQASYYFTTSPEFQAEHASGNDYVTALYQDVLLRAPASSDLTYWQNTTAKLPTDKQHYQEAASIVNGQEPATRIVDAFYFDFLHRAADAGAQDLINNLAAGKITAENAGLSILASDEFFALAGGK